MGEGKAAPKQNGEPRQQKPRQSVAWWEIAVGLVMVVAICAGTWPATNRFWCRAQQSEARHVLTALHAAESLYQADHGRLAPLDSLAVPARGVQRFYHYEMKHDRGTDGWQVCAHGRPGTRVHGDSWCIDAEGRLRQHSNVCRGTGSTPARLQVSRR